MAKVLGVISSLITIFQFLYLNVFREAVPTSRNVFLDFGTETKAVLFVLCQLAAFFLAYLTSARLIPKVRDYALLLFVFALNIALVDYASSLNFRLFWGKFNPQIPFVNSDGDMNHMFFLCFTTAVAAFVTKTVAEGHGWRWQENK